MVLEQVSCAINHLPELSAVDLRLRLSTSVDIVCVCLVFCVQTSPDNKLQLVNERVENSAWPMRAAAADFNEHARACVLPFLCGTCSCDSSLATAAFITIFINAHNFPLLILNNTS